jgi:hypothetical protein
MTKGATTAASTMSDNAQNGRRAKGEKEGLKEQDTIKKEERKNISPIDPDTFDLLTFLLQSNFIKFLIFFNLS